MSKISRTVNAIKYGFKSKLLAKHRLYRDYAFDEGNLSLIKDFVRQLDCETVFAFVGLRDVKHSLGLSDPVDYVQNLLLHKFKSVIVPTFTPSVRKTGFFHVKNTLSEVGAFSKHISQIADYRTPSPLKSYAVVGPIDNRMRQLQFYDDFGTNGSYEFLVKNKISVLNIGTRDPRFSCIHYVEYMSQVPYCSMVEHHIEVADDSGKSEIALYRDIHHTHKFKNNLRKIEQDLINNGLMHKIKVNDLMLRILPNQDYFDYLLERCKQNPYYLVD